MALATYWLTLLMRGLGLAAATPAVQSSPLGMHHAWQVLAMDTAQCLERAQQALVAQRLDPIQADVTSIAGRSESLTAMFMCIENPAAFTTVVVVAGTDDNPSLALWEVLKLAF